ncbi:translation initiation factor IF-2 [Helicobacter canis]|uniref:Translation initiation factor IF-2 n=1 Tax=Helicobacter canis TaxID=29419 RepID=A0A377J5J8_9HELI|nr:translation initiation factor IF-2 [Helicobacter canis]STO97731.1 translation initiation factor IF-2 [Helicobacter canis]
MSDKVKIIDIAADIARTPKEVFEKAKELGLDVKNTTSSVDVKTAEILAEFVTTGVNKMPPPPKPKAAKSSTKATKTTKTATKTTKTDKPAAKKSPKPKESPDTPNDVKEIKSSKKSPPTQATTEQNAPQESKQEVEFKKDSTLAQRNIGIRIVKKTASPATSQDTSSKKSQTYAPSIQELMGQDQDIDEPIRARKSKKPPKKAAVAHRGNEQKIELLDRDFGTHRSDYDEEQDEIMLFDFSEREIVDEDKENQERQAITDRVKIQRKNPWLNEHRSISRSRRKKPQRQQVDTSKVAQSAITIPEEIRVYEFAESAGRPLTEVIKVLFGLGLMVTKNDFLDKDAIEILAEEFQISISIQAQEQEVQEIVLDEKDLAERPPVVTIMGHVDHGKTSLLDRIRESRVASGEAGGITQHIGAYMVEKNGKFISFIDTPGHEAFSEMRSRGAQVTDIAIIVIAADDGVKQQTIEALNHAKAANVQIIIAMNKMDKESANPDKLKSECAELGFVPNDWGGEYEFIPISAKSGDGIDVLLETILLHAEVLELKACPKTSAQGVVLEGSMQKGRGPVATIIIKQGTLKVGDPIYAGTAYGRVRSMVDDMGREVKELTPSSVASIAGLSEVPSAGSMLYVVESDSQAREKAQKLATYLRQKELSKSTKVSFDELSEMVAQGQLKNIPLIIKADTQGSLEAITQSLQKLSNNEVKVSVVGSGVGGISESDVALAAASANSMILGFGLRPTGIVKTKAKESGVEIKTYSVIYDVIDDVKALISGLMSPLIQEEDTGQAEVRDIFTIAKVGTIAGCMVTDGKILRGVKIRLIRDGVVIHTGSVASLKRFKDDAKEVAKGYECGIMLENYNDVRVGDVFESFIEVQKAQTI